MATGPDDLEMDVNTNFLHATLKLSMWRVLIETKYHYSEVSKLTKSSKIKTTGYSFTYEMRYEDVLRGKSAQPKKSFRR